MLLLTILYFTDRILQHAASFPPEELAVLRKSIEDMVTALDQATFNSSDIPDAPPLVVAHHVRQRRGRPRIHIEPQFLQMALELRGPTGIAPVLNCSARTIRRRALEANLAQPGAPVVSDTVQADGSIVRQYRSSTRPVSTLTDEELDHIIGEILEIFPNFGRRMLAGRLKAGGHHVPQSRLTASYIRVHGPPGVFGDRSIHRRTYHVAGANSLVHHDGQHGDILS